MNPDDEYEMSEEEYIDALIERNRIEFIHDWFQYIEENSDER